MADLRFSSGLAVLLAVSIGTLLLLDSRQSQPYLDEVFHIPQAQKYCEHKFSEWNPKITTLPGLYLVSLVLLQSAAFVARIQLTVACSTFWLRFANVLFAVGNAWLIREVLIKLNNDEQRNIKSSDGKADRNQANEVKCSTTALILSTFPVLYFFTFLYYTDAGSTFFVLLTYLMSLKEYHALGSAAGFAAIMFRQTNVIWVVFAAGTTAIHMLKPSVNTKLNKSSSFVQELIQYIKSFLEQFDNMITVLWPYGLLVGMFVVFVVINGGIVVGDRSSHEACLNVPQVFYFLAFTLVFSSPLLLLPDNLIAFLKAVKDAILKPVQLLTVILIILLMFGLVSQFTYVHKYLLADNRHYPFYIWRKFYARHWLVRYLAIPVYIYASFGITALLSGKQSKIWQLVFWICVSLVLVPQKLFEFRYFIVPYILLRVNSPLASYYQLVLEFCVYLIINLATIYLFLEKPFVWAHEPTQVQRFMW